MDLEASTLTIVKARGKRGKGSKVTKYAEQRVIENMIATCLVSMDNVAYLKL